MSHANISVFVPHLGCPHRCSFCDQNTITGVDTAPDASDIEKAVATAKASKSYDRKTTELAFFGGSFTGIEHNYMISLLEAAKRFVDSGDICGIRISTRPDYIDREILDILKQYGVTAIELGAQSMCDDVLAANNRGHKESDVKAASSLIKQYGFSLGLQMMTGLYKSTYEKDVYTAQSIIALSPDTVRIYPTVTLEGTALSVLYKSGKYLPPTLGETVCLCSKLLLMFENAGITVIRCGLHEIDESRYVAGPWHPSFKELCDSKRYLDKIFEILPSQGDYILHINPRCVSKAVGNKKSNITALSQKGYRCRVVADRHVGPFDVEFERMKNS